MCSCRGLGCHEGGDVMMKMVLQSSHHIVHSEHDQAADVRADRWPREGGAMPMNEYKHRT